MNRISLATGLAAILFLAPSCSESQAAGPSGTYTVDPAATAPALLAAMQAATPDLTLDKVKEGLGGTLELKSDNTFVTTDGKLGGEPFTNKGTWSVKDGTITIEQTHANGEEKKQSCTATLKDGVLTMTTVEGGVEMKIVFNKAEK